MNFVKETKHFDAVVIGSGQGGTPLANTLGKAGWKVALVERRYIGGSCVNEGCTPTKTMVASARVAHLVRRAPDYGIETHPLKVNFKRIMERKQNVVEMFRNGGQRGLEKNPNVELIFGEAHFTGKNSLEVDLNDGGKQLLSAEKIFINTGTSPRIPDIPGLREVDYLTSRSIMELETLPEHLIVLGGGYIGLEFGQMFHRFGSQVTIIHRGTHLLSREDADVGEEIGKILSEEGISVLLQSQARTITRDTDQKIKVVVKTPEGEVEVVGSHLLVAIGRVPNSAELNLEQAGVRTDERGFITVNEKLETNVPGIYALGDVKGGPAFTHISYDDFRVLRENLLNNGQASIRDRLVPYTVFIDPQLGRVGLSEKEARAKGYAYQVAKLPMSHVARAIEMDETRGFMKALVDEKTEKILGCAILGVEGGEVMSVLQAAMMGNLSYKVIKEAVFAHPLLAESLNNLFMTLDR